MNRRKFIGAASGLLVPLAAPAIVRAQVGQIPGWPPAKFKSTGGGGFSFVASTAIGSSTGNTVTTSPINTAIGPADLIILGVGFNKINIPTFGSSNMSDSQLNTWTAGTIHSVSGAESSVIFYKQSPSTSATHTFTVTGTSGFFNLFAYAFSGSVASPFDVENGNSGLSPNTLQTGSVTPSLSNELLFTHILINGVPSSQSIDSGFIGVQPLGQVGGQHYGGAAAYLIQGAAAAVNPTWSFGGTTADSVASIATFK